MVFACTYKKREYVLQHSFNNITSNIYTTIISYTTDIQQYNVYKSFHIQLYFIGNFCVVLQGQKTYHSVICNSQKCCLSETVESSCILFRTR